jgi:hypothetical protein
MKEAGAHGLELAREWVDKKQANEMTELFGAIVGALIGGRFVYYLDRPAARKKTDAAGRKARRIGNSRKTGSP